MQGAWELDEDWRPPPGLCAYVVPPAAIGTPGRAGTPPLYDADGRQVWGTGWGRWGVLYARWRLCDGRWLQARRKVSQGAGARTALAVTATELAADDRRARWYPADRFPVAELLGPPPEEDPAWAALGSSLAGLEKIEDLRRRREAPDARLSPVYHPGPDRRAPVVAEECHREAIRPRSGGIDEDRSRGAFIPPSALDERVAIVGTSGSGKTYAAKGLVERLLDAGARVCVVDPLGVWWGLRAGADGASPGYPVVVFGGRHGDVALDEGMGAALGRLVGTQPLACVVDLSDLGGSAARRRFMSGFAEALYEANGEPLHLVLDEADLFAPQRPLPDALVLLNRVEEIVRRGRVRGFVPWLITQRPAVVHKDVLSQADILIAMKLTSSQDRDAVGGWIEGQADRAEGKRILAELPRLPRGEGYLWAPGHDRLARVAFPPIRTHDSSRTPKRGEQAATPRTLAEVDLSAITAALAEAGADGTERGTAAGGEGRRQLAAARARVAELEAEVAALRARLGRIAALVAEDDPASPRPAPTERVVPSPQPLRGIHREAIRPVGAGSPKGSRSDPPEAKTAKRSLDPEGVPGPVAARKPARAGAGRLDPTPAADGDSGLHPAARKLLLALARHAPARFTWGQAATLAGLKPSGGHFNAGRKYLRDLGLVEEAAGTVAVSPAGLAAAGEVPPAPSTVQERLALWCERLPSPAPEMLRALAAKGERYTEAADLAAALGRKPSGGHWNSGVALLRNNGLIEVSGKSLRAAELFR